MVSWRCIALVAATLVSAMTCGVKAFVSSPFVTGTMNMGLRYPAATSTVAPKRGQCARGAADTVMMPIGVPKVAYRVPGAQQADWVDIYNRLYRERIIFLGQEIDDELANQIIGVMLYLDSEDSEKPIYLYVNCPGGSVIAGLAMFDTIQHIRSDVVTINVGMAASMASFILAAGAKGKRMALPHSRVMIHQPMGGAQGQAEDIKVEATQIMRIRDNIVKMYSMMTGQSTDAVTAALDRDNFMSAEEAKAFGVIDQIIELRPKIGTEEARERERKRLEESEVRFN